MCECGCTMGNPAYRLPIDENSCYSIELYPGCTLCDAAPAVVVRKVDRSAAHYWEELEDAPPFPLGDVDGVKEGALKCGLDPEEFRRAAVEQFTGTKVEGGVIDGDLAEILGDDLWGPAVRRRPEVIEYREATRESS